MGQLKITLVKSKIGRLEKHKRTVEALGLRKIGHEVVHEDNPAIRGMIDSIHFMLKVEELN